MYYLANICHSSWSERDDNYSCTWPVQIFSYLWLGSHRIKIEKRMATFWPLLRIFLSKSRTGSELYLTFSSLFFFHLQIAHIYYNESYPRSYIFRTYDIHGSRKLSACLLCQISQFVRISNTIRVSCLLVFCENTYNPPKYTSRVHSKRSFQVQFELSNMKFDSFYYYFTVLATKLRFRMLIC